MSTTTPAIRPDMPAPGPFSHILGFRYVSLVDGEAVIEVEPTADHCNGGGIVHGGFLATMLDTATGWAAHDQLPPGSAAPTIQLAVQYVRAALPGSTLVCRGRTSTAGKRIVSAEAEITQGGRLIAKAVASHAVIS